jgi:hypothetical protein
MGITIELGHVSVEISPEEVVTALVKYAMEKGSGDISADFPGSAYVEFIEVEGSDDMSAIVSFIPMPRNPQGPN